MKPPSLIIQVYASFLQAGGDLVIDSTVLHATDIDSNDETLKYYITEPPRRGSLYLVDEQGDRTDNIVQFTPQQLLEGKRKLSVLVP